MKLQLQTNINTGISNIYKSITESLKTNSFFVGEKEDTATYGVELKPPVPMKDCKYVFDNSSYVAKCCRILAKDIILNKITLISDNEENDTVVKKIQDNLIENIMELYYLLVDYYYAGIGAVEYATGKHKFKLKQIPINTTRIIRVNYKGKEYYLLEQKIDTKTNYFKIMGEVYPPNFSHFQWGSSWGLLSYRRR